MSSEASPPTPQGPVPPVGSEPSDFDTTPRPASPAPRGSWIGWLLLIALIFGITGAALVQAYFKARLEPLPPPIKAAPAFTLTDDHQTSFSSQKLAGEPYIIDFIFTRCGGQCPMMTMKMRDLQRWLKSRGHDNIRLVSVTVDPEYDTPEVLAAYAERWNVDRGTWTFLTGPRQEIYPLIQQGFMLGVEENKSLPIAEQFIHSPNFVLVDKQGQILGFYDATDDEQMKELRRVIESMGAEKKKKS